MKVSEAQEFVRLFERHKYQDNIFDQAGIFQLVFNLTD